MNSYQFILLFFVFGCLSTSKAQQLLTQQDLCPDYKEVDPLQDCQSISSYAGLKEAIEQAPVGTALELCPFFVQKVSSLEPIIVNKSITVKCIRHTPDDICIIDGFGTQLYIDTLGDTLWQGMSFRGSDDHAVYIVGEVDNAKQAIHTFCQSSFMNNVRNEDSRGGALMMEPDAGTINVVQSFFSDNFSKTYGAAIYSRAEQLNIINSIFLKNRANGYGGAVFTAAGASLMIRDSQFLANRGREGHDIVFNPRTGSASFVDGLGNTINDGACKGVFNLELGSCVFFQRATPAPTVSPTKPPTPLPTTLPTLRPTNPPTALPTPPPTDRQTDLESPMAKPNTVSGNNTVSQPPTSQPNSPPTPKLNNTTTIVGSPNPTPTTVGNGSSPQPTKDSLAAPTRPPTREVYVGEGSGGAIPSMCSFSSHDGNGCIVIRTFEDFRTAIEEGDDDIVFCGDFRIRKEDSEPFIISKTVDIRCLEKCTIFGIGPFLQLGGAMSKIRIQNMQFINAEMDSAVLVSTMTSLTETTFCETVFESNNLRQGDNGGAIYIDRRSGVVNVVRSTFTDNSANRGGAIYSDGWMLNVLDSRFIANKAYYTGNAIFVGEGSQITLRSSTFILNSIEAMDEGVTASTQNHAITVQPNKSIRTNSRPKEYTDAGQNRVIMSGDCNGFYDLYDDVCDEFVPMITR